MLRAQAAEGLRALFRKFQLVLVVDGSSERRVRAVMSVLARKRIYCDAVY